MRVCACEPLRPGKAITAAPFFEGTYQPWSSRPSLVLNETFSCAAPRLAAGTVCRMTCVMT